jgi:hypothetical protein
MKRTKLKLYVKYFAPFAQNSASFAFKKMHRLNIFLLLIIIVDSTNLYCQPEKLKEFIASTAEELAADESDPEAASDYIEKLYDIAENPVKLNSADESEISRLFFLSDFQVKVLADYVRTSGRIVSVYEIANIPGFDRETAEMIMPLITFESRTSLSADSSRWRSVSLTTFTYRDNNDDTAFLGGPLRVLERYRLIKGSFSAGLVAEKDPGERFFTGNPPLPDFISANVAYNGTGVIRRVILGDYSACFGQGTNINTGISTGLSLTAPGYMSSRNEIRPYTSTDENNFFRGAAAGLSYKDMGITLFYSRKETDASVFYTPGSSEGTVGSFYRDGAHNTPSLLKKKDTVEELARGININYNFNNLRIGFTWSGNRFSLPVVTEGSDPDNYFSFNGKANNVYTLTFKGLLGKMLMYGEMSSSGYKKYAIIQGLSFRPSDRLTINYLYRNYSGGFISFHGKGTGSSSSAGFEREMLGNFTLEAARHLFISGGCDIRDFPWLKYRNSSPSHSLRKELRIRYFPDEKVALDISYSYRLATSDASGDHGIPQQENTIIRSLKTAGRVSLTETLLLGTIIENKFAAGSTSRGTVVLQDISYKFSKLPLRIWFRYCLFRTDDWDTRIYTYENDLLNSFSIPALSGEGSRTYIMAELKTGAFGEVRFKYGITSSEAPGKDAEYRNELKLQVRIRF